MINATDKYVNTLGYFCATCLRHSTELHPATAKTIHDLKKGKPLGKPPKSTNERTCNSPAYVST